MADKSSDIKTGAKHDAGAGGSGPNEGEGSQTGAREYNEATRAFVESGKVKAAAEKAEKAIDGPEAADLKRAEAEGKKHSHGEDPLLRR
jgi:hypothetical protein